MTPIEIREEIARIDDAIAELQAKKRMLRIELRKVQESKKTTPPKIGILLDESAPTPAIENEKLREKLLS